MKPEASERIRGRVFTAKDIALIGEIVDAHFDRGRTAASIEVCKALNWRQPNGWLKDRACRDVLRELNKRGYLKLPDPKTNTGGNKRCIESYDSLYETDLDISEITSVDFGAITASQVKGTKDERQWNWLVNRYHYLGFSVAVGRSLKYSIREGDRLLAALCFSDPAWSVKARDSVAKTLDLQPETIRQKTINNVRFVIFPWVKVQNLASRVLSLTTNSVKHDWEDYYATKPIMIETFVDTDRFQGTSYRAANWFLLGQTKGYKKSGRSHRNSQSKKSIYVYPLERRLRNALKKFVGGDNGISYREADK